MRVDPRHNGVEVIQRFSLWRGRPAHDDHFDSKRARRLDLWIGGATAAVLGDKSFYPLALHERELIGEREGPAREDKLEVGKGVDFRGLVDRAHDIAMLRRSREGGELQPALGEENCFRCGPESADGLIDCRDFNPAIIGFAYPGGPAKDDERRIGCAAGSGGVGRYVRGERMGRIDDGVDALGIEIGGQTFGAPKPADPLRDRRRRRIGGRPRKREKSRDSVLIGDPPCEGARFQRAAENEQAKARHGATP